MNVHVDRIAQWQAVMGSFAPEPTPSPLHLVASDSDAEDDDDDDGHARSTDEIST